MNTLSKDEVLRLAVEAMPDDEVEGPRVILGPTALTNFATLCRADLVARLKAADEIDTSMQAANYELRAVIEHWKEKHATLRKWIDDGSLNERLYSAGVEQEKEIEGLRAEVERLKALLYTPSEPKLQLWFGAMPESNGKSNWTAVLHTGDFTEGFTIARSEYKDRVRYAADRVRFLIGEIAERPDVLAYDENLICSHKETP